MKNLIKHGCGKIPIYVSMREWIARWTAEREVVKWQNRGRPPPPPHLVKQRVLRSYAECYGLDILVETGTYYGAMVQAMKDDFDIIYSIELSRDLYEKAMIRFRNEDNIHLINGDSGVELEAVLKRLDRPALFWLDGHYSAGVTARGAQDTPVLEELGHILNSGNTGHVVIIDDARCFGSEPSYPSISELTQFIKLRRPDMDVVVEGDSIRLTPRIGQCA